MEYTLFLIYFTDQSLYAKQRFQKVKFHTLKRIAKKCLVLFKWPLTHCQKITDQLNHLFRIILFIGLPQWRGFEKNLKICVVTSFMDGSCIRTINHMTEHLPFSIQGLFFLSGAWIKGSVFSCSSMNSFNLKIKKNPGVNRTLPRHGLKPKKSYKQLFFTLNVT